MSDFLNRISKLSPKRLALLAADLQAKLEKREQRDREPIAIVGIGCRLPGGANDAQSYWDLLSNGVDAIREVPADRWNLDDYYDPDPEAPGKLATRWGGFIDDVDQFDAKFFGITPREAINQDPQQRLLLEVAWEALENAGQAPDQLMGSPTGVFLGQCSGDYYQLVLDNAPESLDAYLVSGSAPSMAAGRISYLLGLHGPSFVVDTACSSSLVALHLACQSLRNNECRMALAGGSNLMLTPETTIGLSQAKMLSNDGHCHTFAESANGIVRGEGGAVVVLKRLSDAQADGDNIVAVIRGTAINQDGRSSGITAPNGPAQEAVIREALSRSDIDAADVDYVETHGTGTTLGDPIEVKALSAVYGEGRSKEQPIKIGSVKTNFGHLEFTAGIAALIKVALSLKNEEIPPHLHFDKPNSHIEWDKLPVTIPAERTPWPAADKPRTAGVSSFGFSGTNAHVIVEQAPAAPTQVAETERPLQIYTLSAKSDNALKNLAKRHQLALAEHKEWSFPDVCFTANAGRAQFNHRLAMIVDSAEQIQQGLASFNEGKPNASLQSGRIEGSDEPEVVFLFTGQGSQYVDMGRELFETQPVFREALERCDEILRPSLDKPLLEVLYPDGGKDSSEADLINQTAYTQPALFALEYSLAQLWLSWGVKPAVVMGHSVGEYVAACIAGVFTLEDGLKLIAERARLMQALPAGGAMAAVFADADKVKNAIASYSDMVSIAALNGPDNTVISGAADAIEEIISKLDADGIKSKPLVVSHAFHSPLMAPMLDEFEKIASEPTYSAPNIGLVSNKTGQLVDNADITSASYWRNHVREPVNFVGSIQTLNDQGYQMFLEIGPHPVLLGMGSECLHENTGHWLPSMRRGQGDWSQMLKSLATLYVSGVDIDWNDFDSPWPRRKLTLPTYPFEHQRYWVKKVDRKLPDSRQATEKDLREWLYELKWRSKPVDVPKAADFIPAPAKIVEQVEPQVQALEVEHGVEVYKEFLPKLDNLCSVYIVQALTQLGLEWGEGAGFSTEALVKQFGIAEQHKRLFGRMLEILGEDSVLTRDGSQWTVKAAPEQLDPGAMLQQLLTDYPQFSAELTLTGRCAGPLADALQEKCDPMQLLFPKGSLDSTEKLYQDAPALRLFNSLVQKSVATAIASLPTDRKLRVLEIGAGTGGTSAYVLPQLPKEQTHYVYTDVSNLFLARAQQKFSDYPFVEYRTLDVGQDPREQGFDLHQFDIILAANVLHATPDLQTTMVNVKKLLAPEGMLVLLEGVLPQRFGDLTVGYTEGWWAFTDTDRRPSYPLMSTGKWTALFEENGFTGVSSVPGPGYNAEGAVAQQRVLLARGPASLEAQAGRWLIFDDEQGAGEDLARVIRADGGRCVTVHKGDAYQEKDKDDFTINPQQPDDYKRVTEAVMGDKTSPCRGVVHLWGVDEDLSLDSSAAELDQSQERVSGSALYLVQALAAIQSPPRLTLVTRGAQPVTADAEIKRMPQTTLWGLGRVIAMEHPELSCVRVDLDPEQGKDDASALYRNILLATSDEDQVALRDNQRFVLRMTPSEAALAIEDSQPLNFRDDATYLITGGLAGLGLLVAKWMVEHGARHLVLMGRREASDEAQQAISGMEQAGAIINISLGDVADRARVDEILQQIDKDKPLDGIIHCAGALDDGALLQQSWPRFQKVMAAKVQGSWNLHALTQGMNLEHFVLFSSGASFLGSPGQGNHAAANAFMDSLAHYRRGQGMSGLSINWGAWSKVGAATRDGVIERLETQGMKSFSPEEGLEILERLMKADTGQVGVLPIHSTELIQHSTGGSEHGLFEELAPQETAEEAASVTEQEQAPDFLDELSQASAARRRGLLLEAVQNQAIKVMGLDATEAVDPQQPLSEMGLDSLMAVELRNALGAMVSKTFPATLLFNYPTIEELANYIGDEVLSLAGGKAEQNEQAAAEREKEERAAAKEEELDELSEDEMADLLAEKLKDL